MKLTVIVEEKGAACNIGGAITHRRITVDLTPEQAQALTLNDSWDSYGTTFLELDDEDRARAKEYEARRTGVTR